MSAQHFSLIILLIGGSVLTVGDIFMKQWVERSHPLWFAVGFVVYMIGMLFLAWSFKYTNIALASFIFVFSNIVILAIISWLYYKEPMTARQIAGLLLGLAAIFLIEA